MYSGLIWIVEMRGAWPASSVRGAAMDWSIRSRIATRAAFVHDVGKMKVPDAILNKASLEIAKEVKGPQCGEQLKGLGLEVDGRREVAAIYDPTRKELFTAERGEGAHLNGRRLRVSGTVTLLDSLLATGFPYDMHKQSADIVDLFGAFMGRARAVRRLGSAALDLCYVAAGRFEGFWEQHLKPWDVAAGALIVREAGGRMSRMDGSAFDISAGSLVASNGLLHDQLLAVISRARAGTTRLAAVRQVGPPGVGSF